MKSWLMPLLCAAALSLPMFAADAQAGVSEETYNVVGFTTLFGPFNTLLEFNENGTVKTDFGGGEFTELDLRIASFVNVKLTDSQDEEFEIQLVALQFGPILIARGFDTDDVQYFVVGIEN